MRKRIRRVLSAEKTPTRPVEGYMSSEVYATLPRGSRVTNWHEPGPVDYMPMTKRSTRREDA